MSSHQHVRSSRLDSGAIIALSLGFEVWWWGRADLAVTQSNLRLQGSFKARVVLAKHHFFPAMPKFAKLMGLTCLHTLQRGARPVLYVKDTCTVQYQ